MEDFFDNELVQRFEQMLENKEVVFFDSDEYLEIIMYYLDFMDLEYALLALEYAEKSYPNHTEITIKWLEYYLAKGNLKKAFSLIEYLKHFEVEDTDYFICLGRYWSEKGMHAKAIHYYQKALSLGEEIDYIHNSIGNEYLDLEDLENALKHFKFALEDNIDDDYAFFSCLFCYDELHKPNLSIEFLQDYINKQPYADFAWFQLGTKQLQSNKYDDALQSFDFAIAINPHNISAYAQKALCYEKVKYWESAIQVYESSLEHDESPAFTHLQIGYCYNKLGSIFKALKSFLQVVYLDAQLDQAWYEIFEIYNNLANYDEALYYINKALEIDNDNINYLKKRAYLYVQLRQFEESIEDFRTLLELEYTNINNYLAFGELLMAIGEFEQAKDHITESIKKFRRAEFFYQLSNCYFLLKDETNGKEYLTKAITLQPDLLDEMKERYPQLKSTIRSKRK